MSLDPAHLMVSATLPFGARFAEENFAGDTLVRQFCDLLANELQVSPRVFVSWCCPPSPFILLSGPTTVLVRSERFDTLLVEYVRLKAAAAQGGQRSIEAKIRAAVFRWVAEFCLADKLPVTALHAAVAAYHTGARRDFSPLRDESLASVDEVMRAALQCCNLAHEFAHIHQDHVVRDSLSASIDGMTMRAHIEGALQEHGHSSAEISAMLLLTEQIDARVLLREVDADLRALHAVGLFLQKTFHVTPVQAVEAATVAIEAQSFLNAARFSCSLLPQVEDDVTDDQSAVDDWLNGAQINVRAKCVMRRAGILLAQWSEPDTPVTADKVNRYVPRVDAMFAASVPFRMALTEDLHGALEYLKSARRREQPGSESRFAELLAAAEAHPELMLDLYQMMIAIGYPAHTRARTFLSDLYLERCRGGLPC